jgi:tRNA(Ile)-lysidine synthase
MVDLQAKWGWQLGVIYCDHQWREDSQANGVYVQQVAEHYGVPFHLQITRQPLKSEAEARTWRYQAFTAVGLEEGYDAVLTGHTASDRAETLLYNLMRGSGADGLGSLAWQRPLQDRLWLVRPLLQITRQETGEFCRHQAMQIWQDSTNDDRQYTRNRIRLDLLPFLQSQFNPQVEQHLAQTAELIQGDVAYLEAQAEALRQQAEIPPETLGPVGLSFALDRRILKTAPLALQRRVIRQFLLAHLPQQPNFEQVEKVLGLIKAPHRSQTDPFPGGAIARVQNHQIHLSL